MPSHRLSLLLAAACLPLAALAAGSGHGQTAAERALETAPGPWQGTWRVTRDDPRIYTRAGAELARLHIIQEQGRYFERLRQVGHEPGVLRAAAQRGVVRARHQPHAQAGVALHHLRSAAQAVGAGQAVVQQHQVEAFAIAHEQFQRFGR